MGFESLANLGYPAQDAQMQKHKVEAPKNFAGVAAKYQKRSDRQTEKQADKQADKQTNRQTEI